jgi:predicted nucleic acid-binding protein
MGAEKPDIYLDANILIYAVEGTADFEAALIALLDASDLGAVRLTTSEFTLAEVLVGPRRTQNVEHSAAYELLLSSNQSIQVIPVDRAVLRLCAEIRAAGKSRLPDAIHLATAELAKSDYFFTEDQRIRPKLPMRVVRLTELDALLNSWTLQ